MDIHADAQLGRKKENNPKPSDLLKYESTHDYYDLIFKSYIKVSKNQQNQAAATTKWPIFSWEISILYFKMIISKTFQAGCVVVVGFYVQKKINLLLGTLGSFFFNTELQLKGEFKYICKINKDFKKNYH